MIPADASTLGEKTMQVMTFCAVGLPPLDAHPGPLQRDMPDEPYTERPSYKKQQARRLLRQAARLADSLACASTPGDVGPAR